MVFLSMLVKLFFLRLSRFVTLKLIADANFGNRWQALDIITITQKGGRKKFGPSFQTGHSLFVMEFRSQPWVMEGRKGIIRLACSSRLNNIRYLLFSKTILWNAYQQDSVNQKWHIHHFRCLYSHVHITAFARSFEVRWNQSNAIIELTDR